VQEFVPSDLDFDSNFGKDNLTRWGVDQYSNASKLIQNKRIQDIVSKRKRVASLKQQQWEGTLRHNCRPKTTSYLQKMLYEKVQSQKVQQKYIRCAKWTQFNQPTYK
jgi:hypothetical protein